MSNQINTNMTDEIICPHCGYEHMDSCEFFSEISNETQCKCERCGEEFYAFRDFSVTYSTEKIEKEATDAESK